MIELIHNDNEIAAIYAELLGDSSIPFRLNDLRTFQLDLHQPPDAIAYLNQAIPRYIQPADIQAMLLLEQYLEYLAAYNRKVINSNQSLLYDTGYLEKLRVLKKTGLNYPQTIFSSEPKDVYTKASSIPVPIHLFSDREQYHYGNRIYYRMSALREDLEARPDREYNEIIFAQQFIEPLEQHLHKAVIIDNTVVFAGVQILGASTIIPASLPEKPLLTKMVQLVTETHHAIMEISYVTAKNKAIYFVDFTGYLSPGWNKTDIQPYLQGYLEKIQK